MSMLLEVKDLHVYYGAIHALKGISIEVHEGEIVTLIGANGAGKTTLMRTISGLLRGREGSISYQGRSISDVPAHEIVADGLCQVPEGRRVFANMTVLENLEMGAFLRRDAEIGKDIEKCYGLFPRLKERRRQTAGTLSGGEQQMLAMGRALMGRPKLLLLDEPSMGLAPLLVAEIFRIIQTINKDENTTVLLVEQNAHQALKIANRGYVIETGHLVLSGPASELADNDEVKKAYLGV